ncbi:hypothetical protein AM500_04875 [Bacillus sp. FJAT-18017]|uniref:O-antigen ligase family protein n=1 Tax=Bacillus sp. FJAT-18017 TaxID=1705566 RepID=UPI0006AE4AEC|nr:O-antigen ligase family protein [Bacillus sp. FJAT-18017]ALC89195.1 hypothetical protein AM500_04875 [Bacillus sp. FJAT-18017]
MLSKNNDVRDNIVLGYFIITILLFSFISTGGYKYGNQLLPDPVVFYIEKNPIYFHFFLSISVAVILSILMKFRLRFDIIAFFLLIKIIVIIIPITYIPEYMNYIGRISYHIIAFIVYLIALQTKNNKIEAFTKVAIVFSIILSIQVIFTSYYNYLNLGIDFGNILYKHYMRIPIASSNVIAAYLVPCIFLIAYNSKLSKFSKAIILPIIFLGVLLTKSDGAIVVFIVTFILSKVFLSKKGIYIKLFFSFLILIAFIIYLVFMRSNIYSIMNGRFEVISNVFKNWEQNILFGNGVIYETTNIGSFTGGHNILLDTLNQSGIIGLTVFIMTIFVVFKRIFRYKKEENNGVVFFIVAFLIHSMGEVNYYNYVGDVLLWFFVGICINTLYRFNSSLVSSKENL